MALDAAMLGAAGNILGGVAGVAGAGLNFASQKDNLAYQKWAQTKSWAREDDAVQRRAADLQAAGLSKTLAAGSAAQTMAPIRTDAPQVNTESLQKGFSSMADAAQMYMSLTAQKAQIDKTTEENKLLRLQQEKQSLENAFMASSNPQSLRLREQEISFNEAANPKKLLQMDEQNKGLDLDNKNKVLDSTLKSLGIDQAQINLIKTKLENDFKRLDIHGKSQDIIAKELALKMSEIDLQNAQYDTTWYHNNQVPKGFNFGLLQGPFGTSSAVTNWLNSVFSNLKRR